MTTLVEAKAELADALSDTGIRVGDLDGVEPPGALIYGDGIDPAHVARGQVEASFRITFVGGGWTGAGSSDALLGVVALALPALRELDGWRVGQVTRDLVVNIAGSLLLGSDLVMSRMVDI